MTFSAKPSKVLLEKYNIANFLLFRAVEIQRICEAAATPAGRKVPT